MRREGTLRGGKSVVWQAEEDLRREEQAAGIETEMRKMFFSVLGCIYNARKGGGQEEE